MACGPASILMAGMMTTGNGFNYTGTNSAFINYLTNIWGGARVGITGSSGTGLAANNSAAKALGMTSKGWIMSDTRSTVFNETNLVKNLFTGYVLETLGYYPLYGSSGAEHFIVINGVEINSSGQARIHTVDPYGSSNSSSAKTYNGLNHGWRSWMNNYSADVKASVYNAWNYYALPIGRTYSLGVSL